jgi:threonine dehydratase
MARHKAIADGAVYVPPSNDPEVIAGQGTIAVELLDQLPRLQAICVAMGGGG